MTRMASTARTSTASPAGATPRGGWEGRGAINATRTVLSIMDRRAKLLGLDAPQRIDLTGWIREMAIAEGLDPDQTVRDAESIVRRSGGWA